MRRFGAFPPTEAQEEKGRRGNVLKHKVSLQLTIQDRIAQHEKCWRSNTKPRATQVVLFEKEALLTCC